MKISTTPCCALGFISGLSNNSSQKDIEELISLKKREKEGKEYTPAMPDGETALMCVVTPSEESLKDRLIEAGFEEMTDIERRNGYPNGMLTIMLLKL